MEAIHPLAILASDDDPEYFDQWPPRSVDHCESPPLDYTIDRIDTANPIETVCIDVDQTIGDVSIASIFYRIWRHHNAGAGEATGATDGPPYEMVSWFFESGGFRPYLKELMRYLYQLRESGKIKKILIHTSLSNSTGYVGWIVTCLEKYCGIDQLIDSIRDRNTADMYSKCGATFKQLEPTDILIDDKPWNAIPKNRALIVTPYYQLIDGAPYIDFFPEDQQKSVAALINYDRRANPTESVDTDRATDSDLKNILIQLTTYFD
jgi:hypothetical protein